MVTPEDSSQESDYTEKSAVHKHVNIITFHLLYSLNVALTVTFILNCRQSCSPEMEKNHDNLLTCCFRSEVYATLKVNSAYNTFLTYLNTKFSVTFKTLHALPVFHGTS